MIPRRRFIQTTAGAVAAYGELGFLAKLPAVSTAEASAPVRFHPDLEPLVRLLEETPRDRVIEEVALRVRRGLTYRELLAGLLLAGVRNIQPRPVGFKFHAVLVVNSAHLASLASPEGDRWLPIFWAIDQFKSSQAADVREGDWTMPALEESKVPPSHRARRAFIDAMDQWDEAGADAAIAGLARTASANELFEIFCRYGARDFRDIGHKAIYVANSFRTLEVIGWRHAEPVLRSLAYALLDRSGARENPAQADLPADRPFRENLATLQDVRTDWLDGRPSADATKEMLAALRGSSASEVASLTRKLLNAGVGPQSVFDALFHFAGEFLTQAPGIIAVHAVTFTNAIHYAWHRTQSDETRRLLLLQNAAFLPLYRGAHRDTGQHLDTLEPLAPDGTGDEAIADIFAEISRDRLRAARKVLGWLNSNPNPAPLATAARRLIFQKGTNSHDYKFSSAVLEDYEHLSPPWRDRLLASAVFYLRGSGDADNTLAPRIRAAFTVA